MSKQGIARWECVDCGAVFAAPRQYCNNPACYGNVYPASEITPESRASHKKKTRGKKDKDE